MKKKTTKFTDSLLTHLGLAILSGGLLFFSAPGPVGFAPCAWIALVPLLFVCRQAGPGRAALLGLLCGLIYYTLLLYWILIVLGTYGYLSWYISVPVLLLLALYMALYIALFSAAISWLGSSFLSIWSAPLLWVGLDYVRNFFLTGFPWQDLGYSQYQFPMLIQAADLAGHYGLTFMIVLANAFFLGLLQRFGSKAKSSFYSCKNDLILAGAALLAMTGYSLIRYMTIDREITAARTVSVGIVQGNIPQNEKWLPGFQAQTIDTYIALSEKLLALHKVQLLIWPETALPFYPMENQLFKQLIDRLVLKQQIPLFTGAPHRQDWQGVTQYYNSSFLIAADGAIMARYDKQHLVPFGEYIPLRAFMPSSIVPVVETMGDFTPGASSQPIRIGDLRLGVLICYESIFPELARRTTNQGADILVNLTNDAWYGRSSAPWQQLSMAVFRAVETKRSLARAANTGISVFIDPLGRTPVLSPLFEPYQAAADLPLLTNKTIFCRIGHLFPPACLFIFLVMTGWVKKKR